MREKYLEPARSVITKIGIEKVARLTGKHPSRVYRWMYPKERGGTGGLIPYDVVLVLRAYVEASGLDLTADDFMPKPDARQHCRMTVRNDAMTHLPPAPPAPSPATTKIPFADISDEMLHDLATTEQIPPALYLAELERRRALRAKADTPGDAAPR